MEVWNGLRGVEKQTLEVSFPLPELCLLHAMHSYVTGQPDVLASSFLPVLSSGLSSKKKLLGRGVSVINTSEAICTKDLSIPLW